MTLDGFIALLLKIKADHGGSGLVFFAETNRHGVLEASYGVNVWVKPGEHVLLSAPDIELTRDSVIRLRDSLPIAAAADPPALDG